MSDLFYVDAASEGRVFMARAVTTAMVGFGTAAGTGGPLLWNGTPSKTLARILRVGFAVTTASTVAGAIGLTGGIGQAAAPTATTTIDSIACTRLGSTMPPQISAYRVGTVSAAGSFFCPLGSISTTALTAIGDNFNWIDIDRIFTIPANGGWLSLSASATLTTAVIQGTIIWEEVNTP